MTYSERKDKEYEHQKWHGSYYQDTEEAKVHDWFQRQAEVTMHDDEEFTHVKIPKAPGAGKMQPDRLQEPFMPATRAAEKAFLLGALCTLFSLVLIPLNAIHLYEGQFLSIMLATGISVGGSLLAKQLLFEMAKRHCKKKQEGLEATMTQTGKSYQVLSTGMGVSPIKPGVSM
jgi:hypothetical protein